MDGLILACHIITDPYKKVGERGKRGYNRERERVETGGGGQRVRGDREKLVEAKRKGEKAVRTKRERNMRMLKA